VIDQERARETPCPGELARPPPSGIDRGH
jgi:hypothetical protein